MDQHILWYLAHSSVEQLEGFIAGPIWARFDQIFLKSIRYRSYHPQKSNVNTGNL